MNSASRPVLCKPTEGRTVAVVGDVCRFLATGQDTNGKYALWEAIGPPGGGPPPHVHSREEEGFFVPEGEYDFRVGERTFRAAPGTFVFGPRGIPHTFTCVASSPGKIQVIISPPGFEAFFEELDVLARQGPPDMGQVIALAGKYGLDILGPPPG